MAAPTISAGFPNPQSGAIGTRIEIQGTNLSNATITVGGIAALILTNTASKVIALLMPHSITGDLVLSTPGTGNSVTSSFSVIPDLIPSSQQGMLIGNDNVGRSQQGYSVDISADGNTALVGGYADNNKAGAAWVFVRAIDGSWLQQGSKLTGPAGISSFGMSVAIASGSHTAVIGAPDDGKALVFTRDPDIGKWSAGPILIGKDEIGGSKQGFKIAISRDGQTIISGGPYDNNAIGAAWIFSKSSGSWVQGGTKLVGTGYAVPSELMQTNPNQGRSVALNALGNTAAIGGPSDNTQFGAVWIFVLNSSGQWVQQGDKIAGLTDEQMGVSVSLSADGNTLAIGTSNNGVYIYTRSSEQWTQQANIPIVFPGAINFGTALCLSASGKSIAIGADGTNSWEGAVWMYTQDSSGKWNKQGNRIVGTGGAGPCIYEGSSVALSPDGTLLSGGSGNNNGEGATWVFDSKANPNPVQWIAQNSNVNQPLFGIFFVDNLNGWAVGGNDTIIATNDGGTNWIKQKPAAEFGHNINSVFFLDKNNGWTAGYEGCIMFTKDGGATWSVSRLNNVSNPRLYNIVFIDTKTGWAVGDNGTILNTTDYGETWNAPEDSPTSKNLRGLFVTPKGKVWTTGIDGTILHYDGTAWSAQSSPVNKVLNVIQFSDENNGWISGEGGTILFTDDAGALWQTGKSGTSKYLRGMAFRGTNAFVVGEDGSIFSSSNGKKWNIENSGTTEYLFSVSIFGNNAWVAGAMGTILFRSIS